MKTAFSTLISAPVSRVLVAACVAVAILAPVAASANDDAKSGKIAVVDIPFLVANSKAGKSIRAQIDSKRDAYRKDIDKQEADLNKQGQQLKAEQKNLSKDEFLKRYKALDEKAKKGQKAVFERTKAFEKAYVTSLEKLREHIVKIIADMAGKRGVALVLNRQEIVLVDAKMDLTKEVLAALDAKVTNIPVNIK